MPETEGLPDLAGRVRPLIQMLPLAVQPRLMATLERAAADRYRAWAVACSEPTQGEGLRACAAREEEVATRIEMAFPETPDEQRHIGSVLPQIAEAYRARHWPSDRSRRNTRFRPRLNVAEQPSGARLPLRRPMRPFVRRCLHARSSKSAAPSFSRQS